MIIYSGPFNEELMIAACRPTIRFYINKKAPTEVEVPFRSKDQSIYGRVQFALLAGQWIFIAVVFN